MVGVPLHSFTCGYLVVPVPFVGKATVSLLNCIVILIKNQLTISIRVYFCTLNLDYYLHFRNEKIEAYKD